VKFVAQVWLNEIGLSEIRILNMKKIITSIIAVAIFVALTGVAQATQVGNVPDAGATSALLGIAVAGLAVVRRFIR
jgi:hypothetical protein